MYRKVCLTSCFRATALANLPTRSARIRALLNHRLPSTYYPSCLIQSSTITQSSTRHQSFLTTASIRSYSPPLRPHHQLFLPQSLAQHRSSSTRILPHRFLRTDDLTKSSPTTSSFRSSPTCLPACLPAQSPAPLPTPLPLPDPPTTSIDDPLDRQFVSRKSIGLHKEYLGYAQPVTKFCGRDVRLPASLQTKAAQHLHRRSFY